MPLRYPCLLACIGARAHTLGRRGGPATPLTLTALALTAALALAPVARSQFAHIVRHDTEAADAATRVLDDSVLFRELLSQGRIRQSLPAVPAGRGVTARGAGSSSHRKSQLSERGHPIDYVDLRAADGGLREWRERFWWPRVYDGETHAPVVRLEMQHGATRESPGGKNGGLRGTPSKNKVRLPLIACPRLPHR